MTDDEATEVLRRAWQGGAFAQWLDTLWTLESRMAVGAAAKEILPPDFRVFLALELRDDYGEVLPPGDYDRLRDTQVSLRDIRAAR